MPLPRSFGVFPRLPNEGSPHQTPASLMVDARYATLRIVQRWSWERYVRLCQFLRMTPFEVASLVMMSHVAVERFKRNGRLSGSGHRAIALVLTLLEAHLMATWTDDVIANPFPDLNARSSTTAETGGGSRDIGAAVDAPELSVGGSPPATGAAAAGGCRPAPTALAESQTA